MNRLDAVGSSTQVEGWALDRSQDSSVTEQEKAKFKIRGRQAGNFRVG